MNYKKTVKQMLMMHSSITKSRLDADDHLFAVIGNGYEWENGELVANDIKSEISKMDIILKILKRDIKESYHSNYSESELHFWCNKEDKHIENLSSKDIADFVSYVTDEIYRDVRNQIKSIKSVDSIFDKYEHIPLKYERGKWKIYPICEYSKLVDFPNDIKPDWAEAMYHFICWCLEHKECLDRGYGLDTQIEYLEKSKERIEHMNILKIEDNG